MSNELSTVLIRMNELRGEHLALFDRLSNGTLQGREVAAHFEDQWKQILALLPEGSPAHAAAIRERPSWRSEPRPGPFVDMDALTTHLLILDQLIAEVERQMPGASILPEPRDYFLATPLYEEFAFERVDAKAILTIEFYDGTLDAHCVHCGATSVFKSQTELPTVGSRYSGTRPTSVEAFVEYFTCAFFSLGGGTAREMTYGDYVLRHRDFVNPFTCSRNEQHSLLFVSRVVDHKLIKIGQYPSLADLHATDLKKYRKVLGPLYGELTKAVGLAAHGVGVGSFVYLRRIFEKLISDAYAVARKQPDWPEEDEWGRKRVIEKIPLLANHLPDFIVRNVGLYGILSKGIHELTEEECQRHFTAVLVAIELILDEELERREKGEKIRADEQALGQIAGQLGRTKDAT